MRTSIGNLFTTSSETLITALGNTCEISNDKVTWHTIRYAIAGAEGENNTDIVFPEFYRWIYILTKDIPTGFSFTMNKTCIKFAGDNKPYFLVHYKQHEAGDQVPVLECIFGYNTNKGRTRYGTMG